MSKEAMKLALEALECVDLADNDRDFLESHECYMLDRAITALREALAQPAQQEPVISKDAYDGAREDLAIWKKRALEAEALNRKFIADINGQTFMGEPAQQEPVEWNKKIRDSVDSLLAQAGFDPDSSVRHQLACMSFDAYKQKLQHELLATNWRHVIPGGRKTDKWDSARIADYNQGWNDYRKAVQIALGKLDTSPPASKPWVGLTRKQVDDLADDGVFLGNIYEITSAIEAKLREKNA